MTQRRQVHAGAAGGGGPGVTATGGECARMRACARVCAVRAVMGRGPRLSRVPVLFPCLNIINIFCACQRHAENTHGTQTMVQHHQTGTQHGHTREAREPHTRAPCGRAARHPPAQPPPVMSAAGRLLRRLSAPRSGSLLGRAEVTPVRCLSAAP